MESTKTQHADVMDRDLERSQQPFKRDDLLIEIDAIASTIACSSFLADVIAGTARLKGRKSIYRPLRVQTPRCIIESLGESSIIEFATISTSRDTSKQLSTRANWDAIVSWDLAIARISRVLLFARGCG